jgi:hypothetical protein
MVAAAGGERQENGKIKVRELRWGKCRDRANDGSSHVYSLNGTGAFFNVFKKEISTTIIIIFTATYSWKFLRATLNFTTNFNLPPLPLGL